MLSLIRTKILETAFKNVLRIRHFKVSSSFFFTGELISQVSGINGRDLLLELLVASNLTLNPNIERHAPPKCEPRLDR